MAKYYLTDYPQYAKLYHRNNKYITAFGLQQSERIFIVSGLDCPILYIASDYISAQETVRQLTELGKNTVYLPFKDEVFLHRRSITNAYDFELSKALYQIYCGVDVVVTSAETLCSPLPYKEIFSNSFTLSKGDVLDVSNFAKTLTELGYVKVVEVTSRGEFAQRGDIFDIFSPSFSQPIRISADYDNIESIRNIKPDLSSGEHIDSISLYPLVNKVEWQYVEQAQKEANEQRLVLSSRQRINDILDEIRLSQFSDWLFCYAPHSRLCDYLAPNTLIMWEEPKLIEQRIDRLYVDSSTRTDQLIKSGEILPQHRNLLYDKQEIFTNYSNFDQVALQQLNYSVSFFNSQESISYASSPLFNYQYNIKQLVFDYEQWEKMGYHVLIFTRDEQDCKRVQGQLSQLGLSCVASPSARCDTNKALILPYIIEKGYISHSNALVIIGIRDLGGRVEKKKVETSSKRALVNIVPGDYVVHELHGIGRCEGITSLSGSWGVKDFILVTYKNNDKLYVPVDSASLLSRFSGSQKMPTLSQIGGKDFEKVKASVKKSIKLMSIDLLKLYAQRENKRGFTYNIDSYLANAFDSSFPYVLTADQAQSISDIDKDLTTNKIMDRLLVGDVGYGKTEVALRTAFKVITNSYQVALLAPTTILAEQHYETAKQRMEAFGIKVACLNRFRTAKEQKDILSRLAKGEIDLLIGTHRLLSKDVCFNKLSMLILDEEQRFGVEHKEKIKELKTNIDVLTLSATPIPRTLYMAMSGIRDISVINTAPSKRIAIETFVVEENFSLIREIILREIMREGQVFLVYNKVESIEAFTARIRELVPEATITFAHGQMDSNILESSIYNFAKGNTNVLIATTIIENGIDMPNANTLIVYDADRLGLAQLYQLRGRVGRSDRLAYAYFVYKKDKILSHDAYARLTSIMEYNQLGSGFKIAMRDLEIRGAGNILGAEQHGFMQKVGYDMYTRLLKEAVGELKGQNYKTEIITTLDSDINAYAPQEYIASPEYRMDFYQKASSATSIQDVEEILIEITEIYGKPPSEVLNLLKIVTIKLLANKAGIDHVTIKDTSALLQFSSKDSLFNSKVFKALDENKDKATISAKKFEITFSEKSSKVQFINDLVTFLANLAK
ncbi:MAG: transcription-repair coupling factor [Clostridia bacterium]